MTDFLVVLNSRAVSTNVNAVYVILTIVPGSGKSDFPDPHHLPLPRHIVHDKALSLNPSHRNTVD